jgi:hypothetical protein
MTDVKRVYPAMLAVLAAMGERGIGKDRNNKQQGFKFRGVDDVYAALNPLLAEHKLLMTPRAVDVKTSERTSKGGGKLFSVVVKMEFDFISAEDGSIHSVCTYGEGMDSGDKATSKAQSIAYKYAVFQAFSIPVEGVTPDPDEESHEVESDSEAIDRLDELLKKHDCPEGTVCKAYGVDRLEDLDPKVYAEVETRIINYGKARKK